MNKIYNSIAIDLGASSGRVILGRYENDKISLQEIHRFPNEPVRMNGIFYWDIFRLFHEIKEGLKKVASMGISIDCLGIDTWGVDYALLDSNKNLIGVPINYRDNRTDNTLDEVGKIIPLEDIYKSTGIQFMNFNTLFQLYADSKMRPQVLDNTKYFLMMPDLFNFFLTKEMVNEYTILSTSQMLDAKTKLLNKDLLQKLNIPTDIFCKQVEPGTILGAFTKELVDEIGLHCEAVVAVGSHDTASAVCGTPLNKDAVTAFLSCGTWSLLGMEISEPIISNETYQYNFTNEGGTDNTIRFLKNINGLWVMQQLLKSYNDTTNQNIGFADIIREAKNCKNKDFIIDQNAKEFMAPYNMMEEIISYCKKNGQGTPEGIGEIAIAVYNGLAKEYKQNILNLEKLTQKHISEINMIGGGIKDEFLCSLTAKETGKRIVAGPVEASVMGNIIMQLKAINAIASVSQGREIIKNSFDTKIYEGDEQNEK